MDMETMWTSQSCMRTALPLLLHKYTDMCTVGTRGAEMRQMSTDEVTHEHRESCPITQKVCAYLFLTYSRYFSCKGKVHKISTKKEPILNKGNHEE